MPLNSSHSDLSVEASSSESYLTPLRSFALAISASNSLLGSLATTSPYICNNRRYESYTHLLLNPAATSASTATSDKPRFNTLSIIPGMDAAAPLRTLSNSGGPVNEFPSRNSVFLDSRSMNDTPSDTSGHNVFRTKSSPPASYSAHAAVVTVNPHGTASPRFAISCKPDPFDPSASSIAFDPSPRPRANRYTRRSLPELPARVVVGSRRGSTTSFPKHAHRPPRARRRPNARVIPRATAARDPTRATPRG